MRRRFSRSPLSNSSFACATKFRAVLANRLNAATTYLVDLKRQFAGYGDHLEMVGEVLETLIHQQERDFQPGSARDPRRA
jgi:hypothetical protein